jgi:hypothetical protein
MSTVAEFNVHFQVGRRTRKVLKDGPAPEPFTFGSIPRVSRLMALAIKFDRQLHEGTLKDYAEIAEVGGVSRARVTQVMNMLMMAPEIQEEILFLPLTMKGRDLITESHVRVVSGISDWGKQRRIWQEIQKRRAREQAAAEAAEEARE